MKITKQIKQNNSLPITDLQLNYKLPFVFHISVLLPLPWVCLGASLNPSAIQSIQCQGVPRFIKKPFIVLEPDIFVWWLISLLSGGDLLIVDTAYIILEPRSFPAPSDLSHVTQQLMNSIAPLLWTAGVQNYYCLFFLVFSSYFFLYLWLTY